MAGMLKTRKVLGATLAVLLLLTGLLYGVYALVLPRVAERVLREQWGKIGLPEVMSVKVESVTPWGLVVRDVTAPGLRVGRLRVGYDLGLLRAGRVGEVELEGLELRVDWREGGLRSEVMNGLMMGAKATPSKGATAAFERIRVRGEVLLAVEWATEVRLPMGLVVEHDVKGRMRVEADWLGLPMGVRVRAQQSEDEDWRVRAWPGMKDGARYAWEGRWMGSTGELWMEPVEEVKWEDLPGVEGWLAGLGVEVEGLKGWSLVVKPRVSIGGGGEKAALNIAGQLVVKEGVKVKAPGSGLVAEGVKAGLDFEVNVEAKGVSITRIEGQIDWQKAQVPGVNLGGGRLTWRGEAQVPWWGKSRGAIQVSSSALDVAVPEAAILVRGLKVDVPMRWGEQPSDGEGRFSIEETTLMGQSLGALTATVRRHDGQLQWESPWPTTGTTGLFTQGDLKLWGREGIEGQSKVSLLDFRLTDGRTLSKAFPQAGLEIVNVTGAIEVHGVFTAERGRWKPWVTVYVREGMVGSVALEMEAKGIEAKMDLDVLGEDGPGSPPFQWVMVKEAQAGRLRLRDGLIQFQMQTPKSFLVERTRWTMGEKGRFWVHSFWMDPTAERIELEVFLEDVNLRDVFDITARDSVAGDGLIYGRIPVMIYPEGQPMVRLGQGFLYSRPGRGWVEIKDRRLIDNLMSDGGVSVGDQIKERFVTALSDFEYSMMRVELLPQELPAVVAMGRTSPVLVRLTIEGKGRRGTNPIEFSRLTINLNGIEDLLDLALRMKREREGMGR